MSSYSEMNNKANIKKLSAVTSVDELVSLLDTESKDKIHDYYHHFTTFSKLEKVLESGKWRFTPDSKKNDLHENNVKQSFAKRNKILSVSFSRGDEDNMAMWAMYGIPWEDAVRITWTKKAIIKWREIVNAFTRRIDNIDYVRLHDIAYYQGFIGEDDNNNNSLILDDEKKDEINRELFHEIQHPDRLSSYIKNSAWKQEQESRMSIFLKEDTDNYLDVPFGKDFSFLLKNMIITFGPWTSRNAIETRKEKILEIISRKRTKIPYIYMEKLNLKKYLHESMSNNHDDLFEQQETDENMIAPGNCLIFSPSPFYNLIKLQRHCDVCPWEYATQIVHNFNEKNSFWIK